MDKNISVSIYLLHPVISNFDEAFTSIIGLQSFDIEKKYDYKAKLYLGEKKSSIPDWVPLLNEGFKGIPSIENISNGAVIICEVEKRIFAITFGIGRFLLNPAYKEHKFGLKVAMNLFSEDGLRSASTNRKSMDSSIITICQSNKNSTLKGLRVDEDIDSGLTP